MVLLAFFGLWETTLLAGATAVSVPVLIHLLNRRRYRIVTWAAMRFLLMAQKQNSRRLKLEQLLLLLCRMGLVLCILLAMAAVTPWAENVWAFIWPDAAGVTRVRTTRMHHIIVLDGSLSMNQGTADSTCFDRARELGDPQHQGRPGRRRLQHPGHEGASRLDHQASFSQDPAGRPGKSTTWPASHGNASVPDVLATLSSKLADNQKRYPGQTIYFFTDMQRATWALPAESAWPRTAPARWREQQHRAANGQARRQGGVRRRGPGGRVEPGGHRSAHRRCRSSITSNPVHIKAMRAEFRRRGKNKLQHRNVRGPGPGRRPTTRRWPSNASTRR